MIFPSLGNSALQVDEGADTFISTTLVLSPSSEKWLAT